MNHTLFSTQMDIWSDSTLLQEIFLHFLFFVAKIAIKSLLAYEITNQISMLAALTNAISDFKRLGLAEHGHSTVTFFIF